MIELDFYQLHEEPFSDSADSRFLYMGQSHREAMASLYYGVESGQGFQALIAPAGMGKTTLLFRAMERWRGTTRTVFLIRHGCDSQQLLELVGDTEEDKAKRDPADLFQRLRHVFAREAKAGRRFVILLDDAHSLDDSTLETVRLLGDLGTPHGQLLQIVLVGRPELEDKLAGAAFVQLRRRLAFVTRLRPFFADETAECIRHRLITAGHPTGDLFTAEAAALIARASGGVPREICHLCQSALEIGYVLERRVIDLDLARQFVPDADVEALLLESVPAPVVEPIADASSDAAEMGDRGPGAGEPGAGEPGAGEPGAGELGAGEPGAGDPGAGALEALTSDEIGLPPAAVVEPEPVQSAQPRKPKSTISRSKKSTRSSRRRKQRATTVQPVDAVAAEPMTVVEEKAQSDSEVAGPEQDGASPEPGNLTPHPRKRPRNHRRPKAVAAPPSTLSSAAQPESIGAESVSAAPERPVVDAPAAEPQMVAPAIEPLPPPVAALEAPETVVPVPSLVPAEAGRTEAAIGESPSRVSSPPTPAENRLTTAEVESRISTSLDVVPHESIDDAATRFAAALTEWGKREPAPPAPPSPQRAADPVPKREDAVKPQAARRLTAIAVLSAIGYQPAPPSSRVRNRVLAVGGAVLLIAAVIAVLSARGRRGEGETGQPSRTAGDPPTAPVTSPGEGGKAAGSADAPEGAAPVSADPDVAPAPAGGSDPQSPGLPGQPPSASGPKIWKGPTEGAVPQIVIVKPNETLEEVCRQYLGRWDMQVLLELRRLNPGLDENRIYAGQRLRLPS